MRLKNYIYINDISFSALLSEIIQDNSNAIEVHKQCQEEFEQLKDQFESYKKQVEFAQRPNSPRCFLKYFLFGYNLKLIYLDFLNPKKKIVFGKWCVCLYICLNQVSSLFKIAEVHNVIYVK